MDSVVPNGRSRLSIAKSLEAFVLVLLVVQAVFFVAHAIQVIRFPHDVDNGEGFLLWQSLEYASGHWPYQPINEAPYLVANYPPVYPLLCSLGTGRLGPSLAVGRTLTFLSALGVAIGLGWIVHRRSQQWKAAALAALFFIGTYHVYNWGSFHRVDMLALFFSVLALAACEAGWHASIVLLACILSLMTRQTMLATPLAIGFYWIAQQRRRLTLLFWLGLAASVGAITLLLNILTDGEYLRHIVLYNQNKFAGWTIFFYAKHLWQFYAILCALGVFYFLRALQQRRLDLSFWFLIFAAGTACLCGKVGSAPNYLLELVLALCWIAGNVRAEVRSADAGAKDWLRLLLPALFLLQVLEPFHLPHLPPLIKTARYDFGWTPTAEDRRREEVLAYRIRHAGGPALIEDPGVALRAGRPVHYQPFILTQLEIQGLWDPAPLLQRIESREFELIVLRENISQASQGTERISDRMVQAIQSNYVLEEVLSGRRTYYLHRPRSAP